ncbi:MAG TPA: aldo/keto reductase [Candidatus Nitrosotalea sp.]|nr:aldo/keto reductase [Candidatus Nitrosotalea sp.]
MQGESGPVRELQLGSAGPKISRVGFGAWALGGEGWAFSLGRQDDASSIAAIMRAVDRGVSWIDTAAVYGCGHSEEVVGKALALIPRAERPLIFTKCGLVCSTTDPTFSPARDLRPATMRREVEESLRRLGVERIDLYQLHWPDRTGTPVEETWGEMVRLIEEGKVAHAGVSNFGLDLLERIEPIRHVDSLQPPFSMIERGAAELLPWAREHGTGVIVYSPMQSGLLGGTHTRAALGRLDAGDWRRRDEHHQEPNLGRNLDLVRRLEPLARELGASLAELAVAWTLAWPGVTGAIVGARSPEQVEGWVNSAQLDLGRVEMDAIADAIEASGAGSGPPRPPA